MLNEKRQGELRPEDQRGGISLWRLLSCGPSLCASDDRSTADIEGATLDDVKHWFRTHYGAGNAVLVLSAMIDLATRA